MAEEDLAEVVKAAPLKALKKKKNGTVERRRWQRGRPERQGINVSFTLLQHIDMKALREKKSFF